MICVHVELIVRRHLIARECVCVSMGGCCVDPMMDDAG